jgi:N-acetylglucosaminyldiphosphoundecaprenol N-acetyl-beta-D-mannosaminyltransferase
MSDCASPAGDRTIVDVRFNLVGFESVMETVLGWRDRNERAYVALVNPHSVMMCRRDEAMCRAIEGAGLTLPDGVGIILAANILGYPHQGRVTGPALTLKLCDLGRRHGLRHFFCGGARGVAEELAGRLSDKYENLVVAGTYCPPFRPLTPEEDDALVARINATRPDIVWIGLGAPKQEKWMADHLDRIDAPAIIGVGAAFDFHSGTVPWSPSWGRKLGLEWAHRLALEPRRMWRRNLDSPAFLLRVFRQRFRRSGG